MSKVMGGWGIWETVNGEQKLTTECIENVIMMLPFSAIVIWNNWRIDVLCGDEGKKASVKLDEIMIYWERKLPALLVIITHLFVVSSRQRSVIG